MAPSPNKQPNSPLRNDGFWIGALQTARGRLGVCGGDASGYCDLALALALDGIIGMGVERLPDSGSIIYPGSFTAIPLRLFRKVQIFVLLCGFYARTGHPSGTRWEFREGQHSLVLRPRISACGGWWVGLWRDTHVGFLQVNKVLLYKANKK